MKRLLDTDICIYCINRRDTSILERLRQFQAGDVGISAITYAELRFGIEKSVKREHNRLTLEKFLLPLEIMPFDKAAGDVYGELRSTLERKGKPIGSNDMLIAAQALSLDVTLVTNNTREFERVPNLVVEHWT